LLTLHLIRHGETNWNRERRAQGQSESELNARGREQAAALQQKVRDLNLSAIYVSSAVRTRQTAEIATALVDLPAPSFRDDLREIDLGPWETRLWDDIEQDDPDEAHLFRYHPDQFSLRGAETFLQLQQRGVSALEGIMQQERQGEVLVVSHGALLKASLLHYVGVDLAYQWAHPELYNCAHSELQADSDGQRRVIHVAGTPVAEIDWPGIR